VVAIDHHQGLRIPAKREFSVGAGFDNNPLLEAVEYRLNLPLRNPLSILPLAQNKNLNNTGFNP
jgi:hypothetical protein